MKNVESIAKQLEDDHCLICPCHDTWVEHWQEVVKEDGEASTLIALRMIQNSLDGTET